MPRLDPPEVCGTFKGTATFTSYCPVCRREVTKCDPLANDMALSFRLDALERTHALTSVLLFCAAVGLLITLL